MTHISPEARERLAKHNEAAIKANGSRYITVQTDEALFAIQEALDERDAARKALDCLKTDFDTAAGENEVLRLRVKELEGALRPFAGLVGEGVEDYADDHPVTVIIGRSTYYSLKLGCLRRAAEAVGGGE